MSDQLEVWTPQPDEWYQAWIKHTKPERRYAVLSLTTGEPCQVIERSLAPSGDHLLCRKRGEEAAVRLELIDGKLRALECVFLDEPQIGQTEQIQIQDWHGNHGSARRLCSGGCAIFCMSPTKFDVRDYQPGDIAEAVIEINNRPGQGLVARLTPLSGNTKEE